MSEWVRAGEAGAPQSSSAPRKARQRLPLVLHLDQTAFGTAEGHGHQAASEPTAASAKTSRCKVQSTPNCGTQGACALRPDNLPPAKNAIQVWMKVLVVGPTLPAGGWPESVSRPNHPSVCSLPSVSKLCLRPTVETCVTTRMQKVGGGMDPPNSFLPLCVPNTRHIT